MKELLAKLGIEDLNSGACAGEWLPCSGDELVSTSPVDGRPIAGVRQASAADYEQVMARTCETFERWRELPAPKRGELVRLIGLRLRDYKTELGMLVSYEMGKILAEGEGEVQEAIDMADFCVGLSRQLYGVTMKSERPAHRMYEHWQPLGNVGIITAFNFPVAVWAWNAFVAAVCGDVMLWKPSSRTPLISIATQKIANEVMCDAGFGGVMSMIIGNRNEVGNAMLEDRRLPLISATGSCRLGRKVGSTVAQRLGRSILELGGNNAVLVMDDADLDLALPAVLFGAVGTAGQRCTSTRRVLLQRGIAQRFIARLFKAYEGVRIGDPREPGTLMGPLVSTDAVREYSEALATIKEQGGEVLCGDQVLGGDAYRGGHYVKPTLVRAPADLPMMQDEVFAPILYLVEVEDLDQAIAVQNDVPQGLSSAIFTDSLRSAETFLSESGSDCGIANVNIGTSGAEIGGAFGGEKDTGGGREAGSDAWKAYMRRQTTTINYSTELPLAQGIEFGT